MYLFSGYIGNYANHTMIDYDITENYNNIKFAVWIRSHLWNIQQYESALTDKTWLT